MMSTPPLTECRACAFWDGETGGATCRRYAPGATFTPFEVARWPETQAGDACGDGRPRTEEGGPPRQRCETCAFWHRPGIGIDPGHRGDRLRSWWQHAGYCRRHAPRPGGDIGEHAFWRATHASDHCFEGRPR